MSFSNALGSVSAMSLSANPVALPVIATAAGVAITVGAATFAYKSYKNYEEKKHRKEIEDINHLHEKYLSRIVIFDYSEIRGFPVIFKLPEDKDPSKVESLHYNDDEIDDIGKTLPHGTDIALGTYREAIVNAILKLKEYYFSRKERHDTTAGVISYLLNMLQTKCLNFEGYEYDIAYLHALSNFVNAYASMGGRDNSQHFSRLNPVYSYMLTARQALERHKEKLSLEEMLGELKDVCLYQNNLLIRTFAKLVNKNKYWNLIKTVAHDEMAQGLLRREYVNKEIKGLVLDKHSQKAILASPVRDWLITLSNYYLETLDPDEGSENKYMINPEILFSYPDLNRLNTLRRNKRKNTEEETKELNEIEDHIKQLGVYFSKSENFITSELDQRTKNKTPKFIPITDPVKIVGRTKILAEYATLIHRIISLQYLSIHLLKSTKQLGEIYMKNPQHFTRVFNLLNHLSVNVAENIDQLRKKFVSIQLASLNNMQLMEKELFPEEVKAILDSASASITRLNLKISAYREKVARNANPAEPTIESVKHEMFEVATAISKMYQYDSLAVALPEETAVAVVAPEKQPNESTAMILDALQKSKSQGLVQPVYDSAMKLTDINRLLTGMFEKLSKLQKAGGISADEIAIYHRMRHDLIAMQRKSETMLHESGKSMDREMKADKYIDLTYQLCSETNEFLSLNADERRACARDFARHIHEELADNKNSFIDEHKNAFSRFMYSLFRFGVFRTESRKQVVAFDNACALLSRLA